MRTSPCTMTPVSDSRDVIFRRPYFLTWRLNARDGAAGGDGVDADIRSGQEAATAGCDVLLSLQRSQTVLKHTIMTNKP